MILPLPGFATAPRPLLVVGLVAGLCAAWLTLRLLRRIGQRALGRGARPIGLLGGGVSLLFALALGVVAATSLGAFVALASYRAFTARTHIAEIQCIELSPAKLRLYYVGIEADGRRGATETYDLDGDEWTVGGEILRFKPALVVLGLSPVYAVHRIEGRWRHAAEANAHRPTAYDREGGVGKGWLLLERHGTRGPLAWMIAGVHGQAVSQLPDRLTVYDLFVTPNGYIIEKRAT